MDVTTLILNLKSKISNSSLDQQMLSKAIKLLELGAVEKVQTFSELPTPSLNVGKLYYVERDGLYQTNGIDWFPIVSTDFFRIFSWGTNNAGQLVNNTTVNTSSPVSAVDRFNDWCQISSGSTFGLAVKKDGTAWCLGGGASSPVSVIGGFTDWCYVSAGSQGHFFGIRQNGTLWAWGWNSQLTCGGWLGDGTCVSKSSPVSVLGNFSDWCQVSAGCDHSLGVRLNGTAWGWGMASSGKNGAADNFDKASPTIVAGGITDWCQVSAGNFHSLGVRKSGVAMAWGGGTCGLRGDGNTVTTAITPVAVLGGFTDWCQVSAGKWHSLGVRQNGTAWAWGRNICGELGDNTTVAKCSPVSVVGGFTNWCQVSAGAASSGSAAGYTSLGVRTNGTAWSWGCGGTGSLGTGDLVNRSSPVSVVGGFTDWYQVSAGGCHSAAIRKIQI